MTTHIRSFTYGPKIKAVLDGRCRQTIRKEKKTMVIPGDRIIFHGWSGKPYYSKWSWRKTVEVVEVMIVYLDENGIQPIGGQLKGFHLSGDVYSWDSELAAVLAKEDFIYPPTGQALKETLKKLNKKGGWEGFYRVIRWADSIEWEDMSEGKIEVETVSREVAMRIHRFVCNVVEGEGND